MLLQANLLCPPGIDDHQLNQDHWETKGELANIASNVLIVALCGSRTCRRDLLHPINTSAREVAKWNNKCAIRLHKLTCCNNGTTTHSLESFVGDCFTQLKLMVFCGVDFAGDVRASTSSRGSCIAWAGPSTFAPLAAICEKQS